MAPKIVQHPIMVDGILYPTVGEAAIRERVKVKDLRARANSNEDSKCYWVSDIEYPYEVKLVHRVQVGEWIRAGEPLPPEQERRQRHYMLLVNMPVPQQRQWQDMAKRAFFVHYAALNKRKINRSQFFVLLRKRLHEILNERNRGYTLANRQIFEASVKDVLIMLNISSQSPEAAQKVSA